MPAFLAFAALCLAEPIQVHHKQGSMHGFLYLKSEDGKVIAIGDEMKSSRRGSCFAEFVSNRSS